MNQQKKSKGFTIIEVVLVLAIAGLIFLMVFIAFPALQRSQKDTQRKNDLSRAVTALINYQSNNNGGVPGAGTYGTLIDKYLGGTTAFTDPSGTAYSFATLAIDSNSSPSAIGTIYVTDASTCNGESLVAKTGARNIAMRMVLEGGGIACSNN